MHTRSLRRLQQHQTLGHAQSDLLLVVPTKLLLCFEDAPVEILDVFVAIKLLPIKHHMKGRANKQRKQRQYYDKLKSDLANLKPQSTNTNTTSKCQEKQNIQKHGHTAN